MALTFNGTTISRVLIVDDDEDARTAFGFALEELGIVPVFQQDRLAANVDVVLPDLRKQADALISDYHLKKKNNYSGIDGDELVAAANATKFPALLCTSYADAPLTMHRHFRRYIPTVLNNDDYNPETFARGLERCVMESKGEFDQTRKPWRSLLRVDEVVPDGGYFYVVIPGWSSEQKIRILLDELPGEIRAILKPGYRLHAQVNRGAKRPEDLFFVEWESR
jgi:CheY-like chemotaxis protein